MVLKAMPRQQTPKASPLEAKPEKKKSKKQLRSRKEGPGTEGEEDDKTRIYSIFVRGEA